MACCASTPRRVPKGETATDNAASPRSPAARGASSLGLGREKSTAPPPKATAAAASPLTVTPPCVSKQDAHAQSVLAELADESRMKSPAASYLLARRKDAARRKLAAVGAFGGTASYSKGAAPDSRCDRGRTSTLPELGRGTSTPQQPSNVPSEAEPPRRTDEAEHDAVVEEEAEEGIETKVEEEAEEETEDNAEVGALDKGGQEKEEVVAQQGIDAAETEGLGATTTPDPKPTQDRLAIGDTVEVFSRSKNAWCVATVLQEKPDGQTILVRGMYMGETMKKWVARDDGEAVRRPTRTADFDPARAGESSVCKQTYDACVVE